jgi:hypothetical protein
MLPTHATATHPRRYDPSNVSTHDGLDVARMTMRALYAHFDLDQNTQVRRACVRMGPERPAD